MTDLRKFDRRPRPASLASPQTYCLVVLATFAVGSLLLVLASVLLPLLFALFLVSWRRAVGFPRLLYSARLCVAQWQPPSG